MVSTELATKKRSFHAFGTKNAQSESGLFLTLETGQGHIASKG
jgi:hypothetical protein